MTIFTLRLLLKQALISLATAAAIPQYPITFGLVPREVTLRNGTTISILERASFNPVPDNTPIINKRVSFTDGGESDYCFDDNAIQTNVNDDSPLSADCLALGDTYDARPGHWTIGATEFEQSTLPDNMVKLASYGTCEFRVTVTVRPFVEGLFGSKDLSYFIYNHYKRNNRDKQEVHDYTGCRDDRALIGWNGWEWETTHS